MNCKRVICVICVISINYFVVWDTQRSTSNNFAIHSKIRSENVVNLFNTTWIKYSDIFAEGKIARMLECTEFDKYGRWDYDYSRLRKKLSAEVITTLLHNCIISNLNTKQEYPSVYISSNTSLHTFVDGDDQIDNGIQHMGGNFGFLLDPKEVSIKCVYAFDASKIRSGPQCKESNEYYVETYVDCASKNCHNRHCVYTKCCHTLSTMLSIKKKMLESAQMTDCLKGHIHAINQVQCKYTLKSIVAIYIRNNRVGFYQEWLPIFPHVFYSTTSKKVPVIIF